MPGIMWLWLSLRGKRNNFRVLLGRQCAALPGVARRSLIFYGETSTAAGYGFDLVAVADRKSGSILAGSWLYWGITAPDLGF